MVDYLGGGEGREGDPNDILSCFLLDRVDPMLLFSCMLRHWPDENNK